MNIDELLAIASSQQEDNTKAFLIPKKWSQGRTVFGGLSAAMLYEASKQYVASERLLRSMSTNFVGPLISEQAFNISVEIVREGKNVSQLQARAIQNGKVCVVSQFCFAADRVSKTGVENNESHSMALPKKAKFIPQIPKVTPKFLQHFDLAIESGGTPFTGKKTSHYHGWMRFKKAPKTSNEAHLICLLDAWPPTLIQQLKWPAPASTVSWNVEFIYPHKQIEPSDWFAYKEDTRQAANGYGHTEATCWDAHGEVVALSRQTVAVFD
ncbi:acyl-CoA thioesterase [Ningiella sp. W23]|uniref:acyl-CoA thioesterase n=1 Tax=Ningiella sp. W23 TaxID=3023715 RepID=UPI003756300E